MIDLTGYLIVGASAAVATAGATKGVEILAHKKGWLAEPDERRLHPVPTPNIGGLHLSLGSSLRYCLLRKWIASRRLSLATLN